MEIESQWRLEASPTASESEETLVLGEERKGKSHPPEAVEKGGGSDKEQEEPNKENAHRENAKKHLSQKVSWMTTSTIEYYS